MTSAYIDTSALAKWYLPETGSDAFEEWIQQTTEACISSLTITEFRCLLSRRQRMGELTATQVQRVYALFQQDIQEGHLCRFPVSDMQISGAALLIEQLPDIPLRSLDALHLSIAESMGAGILATADQVMIQAAYALSLAVVRFDQ